MTLTPQAMLEALGWLSDLPGSPKVDPRTEDGRRWLARLGVELSDVHPSPEELVAACRTIARRKDARHPTPGQIASEVLEHRRAAAREERSQDWRQQRVLLPGRPADGGYAPEGWSEGRDQAEVYRYIQGLVSRGHAGREQGEMYVVAMLREERERAAAEARGEVYRLPRYGPSLGGGGDLGRLVGSALGTP